VPRTGGFVEDLVPFNRENKKKISGLSLSLIEGGGRMRNIGKFMGNARSENPSCGWFSYSGASKEGPEMGRKGLAWVAGIEGDH